MAHTKSLVHSWFQRANKKQRMAAVAFLSLLLAVIFGAVATFALPFAERLLRSPTRQYEAINIGDSKAEVEYKLGVPKFVLDPPAFDKKTEGTFQWVHTVNGDSATDQNALKSGDDFTKYDYWQYPKTQGGDDPLVSVDFDKDKKVKSISCMSLKLLIASCEPIFGIGVGDKEDAVAAKFGKPNMVKYDGTTKSLLYQHLHLIFTLEKQRVYIINLLKDGDYRTAN